MLKGLVRKVFSNKTLFYPGCVAKELVPEISENYQEILKKLGIDFIMVNELLCSGSPVLDAGYVEEFEKIKEKNLEILDNYGVSRIVTSSATALKVFKQDYGLEERGIKVVHVFELLASRLEKVKDLFKKGGSPKVSFHDSCYLGRYCGIYDEPRKLIIAAGYGLEEFKNKREHADCCGVCGGVAANFPQLSGDIARNLLKKCKADTIVTASQSCYLHLKNNSKDVKIVEVSHLIKNAI